VEEKIFRNPKVSEGMLCLGIEGTAEKLGVGIVSTEGEIHANVLRQHIPKEGIHPREAAQHHSDNLPGLIQAALKKAGVMLGDIGLISFSQGPGLGPCLRVAAIAARTISISKNIPIIGVNHCIAHLEIGRLVTNARDPVMLYVSGGNTQVIAFEGGKYRVFGETLDIALGNCLDQFARGMKLGFPGGPIIEKLAQTGSYIPLPYVVKGMDMSFSGLLTASLKAAKNHNVEDVCKGLQETSFAMCTEVTERAMAHTGKEEVLLAGGVVANKRLQEMVKTMVEERGAKCYIPDKSLVGDNGAMIAWLGILMYVAGVRQEIEETNVNQRFRTDDVNVVWK
jgi:N6-L-threonylcarbamoyladenine synthase/protein kinase Bud32